MNEPFVKWLAEQSDRGLFIIALAVGGWLFWRVLKRSETQTDTLVEASQQQIERHGNQMEVVQNQLFKTCADVAQIVALNTAATERNSRMLERVEQKL